MVKGLDQFKRHFSSCLNQYVLIGGTACEIIMRNVGIDFRATKDLDIVLHLEALNKEFIAKFWQFIDEGGYQHRQQSTGKEIFYRFYSPNVEDFPAMLELFSRNPDDIKLSNGSHLTPIPINESITSLSAILLDNDYYHFIFTGKQQINGFSVLAASHLIPLKARAWLDLRSRKNMGSEVDERDIKKHKNDILRLYQLLALTDRIFLPLRLRQDLCLFLDHLIEDRSLDLKKFGLNLYTKSILYQKGKKWTHRSLKAFMPQF